MKLIDHTPYLDEMGEVSFINQILATLKFGYSWYPEIKAQRTVMEVLSRNLIKGYTLLRNITLPGSQVTFPLILIGPAGVFVIFVTHLKGNYQAKGESWGVIEGNRVQNTGFNPLVLTSKMAASLQRYLEKQKTKLPNVDGILVAVNPGMHIESIRPIVRVVMSDAIEHLVVTINNSSTILDSIKSQAIIRQLTEPKINPPQTPIPINAQPPVVEKKEPPTNQDSAPVPEIGELLPWSGENLGFDYNEDPDHEKPFSLDLQPDDETSQEYKLPVVKPKRSLFDKKQWVLLISFGIVELVILFIFFLIIYLNS